MVTLPISLCYKSVTRKYAARSLRKNAAKQKAQQDLLLQRQEIWWLIQEQIDQINSCFV